MKIKRKRGNQAFEIEKDDEGRVIARIIDKKGRERKKILSIKDKTLKSVAEKYKMQDERSETMEQRFKRELAEQVVESEDENV